MQRSPPNKAILDASSNIYNALLLAFAIGGFITLKNAARFCRIAMGIFIAIQIFAFPWGFFPMDVPGTVSTSAGIMHNVIAGVMVPAIISLPLLMGLGMRKVTGRSPYSTCSLISSALNLLTILRTSALERDTLST